MVCNNLQKRVAVVILNWNGAHDTIACIRSFQLSEPTTLPIIIDNGSTDDSFLELKSFVLSVNNTSIIGTLDHVIARKDDFLMATAILVDGKENLGFAAGSNIGLKIATLASLDVTIFLNNDTIVEPTSLSMLASKLRNDRKWFVVFPLLTIYGTDKIWNCGGRISRLGLRRYYYAGAVRSTTSLPKEIPCSFFTGCCFAVLTADFLRRGGFTERFFFGEEDFEFSLWMKDYNLQALCLTDSVVHHKVSNSISSIEGASQGSKVFIYYLNRFIHMRLRFGTPLWMVWLLIYLPYISYLLIRRDIVEPHELPRFLSMLLIKARVKNGVTRGDFDSIMRVRPW
jgi:GT2 family glycosyltransferase